jgi:TatD DNase family protein
MYFDIHKHLSDYAKADKKAIINIFLKDINSIEEKSEFSYSIGIHPSEVQNINDTDFKLIDCFLSKSNISAIGEIGLDKIYPNYEKQKIIFQKVLIISEQHNLPVLIHAVKSASDILYYRKKHNKNPWIIHSFRGKWKLCKQYLNSNCYISLGAYIVTCNNYATDVIENIPLDKLFFETDNTDIKIDDIYKKFAKTRNISLCELQKQIVVNKSKIFGVINK